MLQNLWFKTMFSACVCMARRSSSTTDNINHIGNTTYHKAHTMPTTITHLLPALTCYGYAKWNRKWMKEKRRKNCHGLSKVWKWKRQLTENNRNWMMLIWSVPFSLFFFCSASLVPPLAKWITTERFTRAAEGI